MLRMERVRHGDCQSVCALALEGARGKWRRQVGLSLVELCWVASESWL
jgi:hypothetical protein